SRARVRAPLRGTTRGCVAVLMPPPASALDWGCVLLRLRGYAATPAPREPRLWPAVTLPLQHAPRLKPPSGVRAGLRRDPRPPASGTRQNPGTVERSLARA